ncbi:aspartyl protease family protein [Mucilaginibacter gracilis]|uniref:aspartyl protease family protein n=1 Tax=Mucilaginibacter gracilis TaxID=423350 RepID=UPI0013C2E31D|nr:aspartyl protease family protein [Mucilaginibacter gracilis]
MNSCLLAKVKKTGFLFCLLCLFILQARGQAYFKVDSDIKSASFPFQLIRNMVVVHVKINNKGPYNFVLDSGVGLMIITDPTLIDSLNIKNKRSILVTGMGEGKDFEAYVAPSLKVTLPGITGNNLSAAVLKEDNFGLSNYAGMPIHGLLGYEFFSAFTVRVNFSDSTITAGPPKYMRVFRRGTKLPITIEEHRPYISIKVKLRSDNAAKNNKLLVDLGAGHALSLENLIEQNQGLPDRFIASNLGISLTGPVRGFLSRINEVELGKYKIPNVITSFPEYDTVKNNLITVTRDGNLGINLLKKFNLIFDYQNGWLYLKPNVFYNDPIEQDMTGIEYYADGADFKHIIISEVENGSGAADIGLQKGDEITRINFKPVSKLSLDEIDTLFKSKDNKSILLDVTRDKQHERVILVLKRRI